MRELSDPRTFLCANPTMQFHFGGLSLFALNNRYPFH